MEAPNDESQPPQGPAATGSQEQDEGAIAHDIMKTVMEEQAYQDLNAKLSSLEEEVARERKEKEEAISRKNELAVVNAQLEEANKRAQNSYVSTSATIREYETRIRLLEEEKTELAQDCSRLQEKSKNDDNLVAKYKEKIDSDSRQIRQLDIERNEAELAKSKYQHQNNVLQAALDIAHKDVEVYTKALMEKETDFSKYRTDNLLELQKVMAERDRESQARAQAQSSERVLRAQYQVNAEDLKKAQAEIQELKNQLGSRTADFKNDASFLQQRVTDLQNQSKADRQMVDELEQAMREEAEQHELAKAEMKEALERARSQQAEAQTKMQEMAKMVELLGADRKAGTGGSISATADLTLALQGGTADSRTVRQALADAVVLQGEVERLQKENVKLEGICRTVLQEINERKPALDRQRAEWEQMKVDCAELASELAETTEAKKALEGKLAQAENAQAASADDNKILQRQVSDLSLQLRNILRQLAIRDDPALAFEAFDPVDGSLKDESDIDLVITSSLVMFNKLPELLELNKRLLKMTRSLGQELEKKEKADGIADANAHLGDLNEAANVIQELTRRIQDMEAQIRDTDAEVSLITKERDMFSRMLVQGRLMGMSLENLQSEDNATVQAVLRTIRAEFDHHREDLQKELQTVQNKLDDKSNELREESNKLADALASLRHEQSQNQMLVQKQAQDQAEITNHLETLAQRDTEIRNLRLDIQKLSDDAIAIRQEKASVQALLDAANAQRRILEANEKALNETVGHLTIEKARLDRDLSTRQLIADQEIMLVQQSKASVEAANASLRQDLESTRAALAREQTAHRALLNTNSTGEELRAAKERIRILEQAATDLQEQHTSAMQSLKSEAEAQKAAYETQKAELEAQKAATQQATEKAANATSIGLKHQRAVAEFRNTTLPNMRNEHEKALAELRTSIESLTAQLNQTRTELESAQRDVARLQGEIASKDAQNKSLQADVATASQASAKEQPSSDASAIQSALDTARQRITELEGQVVTLSQNAQKPAEQEGTSDLQSRLQTMTAELDGANKKIEEIQSQLAVAQSESQQTIAELQSKLTTAEAQSQKMASRVQELEELASTQITSGQSDPSAAVVDNAANDEALKTLQAEYDAYKVAQNERFATSVSRVNAANKKLLRDSRELKMVKNELAEELLKEDKLQAITTPAEFAQKVRETLAKVHNDSFNATEERPEPPKAIGVQTESIAAETAGAPVATTQPAVQLSAELEQLKKQLEEATKLAESRSQEARAADEKAKKLAVKANQADKLKAMANDLKAKLAELQNAKAGASMLSVKGGAAAQATSPGNSAVNAIDVAGSAGSSGDANAPVGAVSVRGRGTARGTATRARVRGGARPATRGINPQAILSQVDAQFRGANDTTGNTMQVKRPAPADGEPSASESDEASKRLKLNDQGDASNGQ